jgi:hypothetical protein
MLASAPAGAGAIMTLNNRPTKDLSQDECMRKARTTIRKAGFAYHDTTSEAVWGLANDRRDMVAIYCLKSTPVAVFAGASPTGKGSVTEPLVDRLTDEWDAND